MIIEIYNKKTGIVDEEKNLGESNRTFRSFMFWFDMQCNTKEYGWRIKK